MRKTMNVALWRSLAAVILMSTLSFGQSAYKQLATYPLPGDTGWDYLTYDDSSNRLFIAHGSSILVVTPDGQKVGEIPANGAHGVAVVPDKNLGFSSNGRAGTVTVFDLKGLNPLQDIKVGENPDAIIYDPYSKHVIVMNGRSKDVMVIDPDTRKVEATIPLGGKLEFAAATPDRIYVNIEDTAEIAVLDPKTWKTNVRWKLPDCEEPSGLAVDRKNGTLFTTCGNSKMLVLDANTGNVLASVKTGDGTDAAAFDAGTGYAFASNGEGTLTVVGKNNGKWQVIENLTTKKSARTMTLDPVSHRLFTVAADFNPSVSGERGRTVKPGTFKLLVFGPAN